MPGEVKGKSETKKGLKLSESQVDGVAYIEQTWWDTGAIPTPEKIADVLGVSKNTVNNWFQSADFRSALIQRGVSLDEKRDEALLTIIQLTVANAVLNFHDKRSLREKLEQCGTTTQQYYAWLRTPAFRQYLAKRGEEMFKSSDHEAYASLLKLVQAEDVQALKLFFEMRGIYNPRVQVDVNVDMVLTRVVEIVARHVKNPAILEAIAADLERLDASGHMLEPVEAREAVDTPKAIEAASSPVPDMGISLDLS